MWEMDIAQFVMVETTVIDYIETKLKDKKQKLCMGQVTSKYNT